MNTVGVLLCGGVLIAATASAGASIVYDNGPPDDEDRVTGFRSEVDSFQVGADFILAEAGILDGVHWWGGYCCENEFPDSADNFTIRIYRMDGGGISQPLPIYNNNIGDVGRQSTRSLPIGGGIGEYQYFSPLAALSVDAGAYLLSIVNDMPPNDDQWHWHTSADSGGSSWRRANEGADWSPLSDYEFSFRLGGERVAVTEPQSLALVGLGLAGLAWSRRRRRNDVRNY